MSTATATPVQFQNPSVSIGMSVLWYKYGAKVKGQHPHLAIVTEVGTRCIGVYLPLIQQRRNSVFHVDNPELKDKPILKEEGAWSHTEHHQMNERLIAGLYDKVAGLEEKLARMVLQAPPPQQVPTTGQGQLSAGIQAYQDLRQRALEIGCEFKGNPSKKALEGMIAEKTASSSE